MRKNESMYHCLSNSLCQKSCSSIWKCLSSQLKHTGSAFANTQNIALIFFSLLFLLITCLHNRFDLILDKGSEMVYIFSEKHLNVKNHVPQNREGCTGAIPYVQSVYFCLWLITEILLPKINIFLGLLSRVSHISKTLPYALYGYKHGKRNHFFLKPPKSVSWDRLSK